MGAITRTCTKCGEQKELALFPSRVKKGVLYHNHTCKKCRSRRCIELVNADPERIDRKRALGREYSKIKVADGRNRAQSLKYYQSEKGKSAQAKWSEINKAKAREAWYVKREGKVCDVSPIQCRICWVKQVRKGENAPALCYACGAIRGNKVKWLKIVRPEIEKSCVDCNALFVGKKGAGARCVVCNVAYQKSLQKKSRDKRKDIGLGHAKSSYRQRCIKYGVAFETIHRVTVYSRDGFKCVYCKCDVVRSKTYQPNQATIDHVIPLSRGGHHRLSNIVTCCHSCNSAKSDRVINKQWIKQRERAASKA